MKGTKAAISALVVVLLAAVATAKEDRAGGWLGVQVAELGKEQRAEIGYDRDVGILVTGVVEGSPAARGGLRVGDVLMRAGKAPCKSVGSLMEAMADTTAGQKVEFAVWRKDGAFEVTIELSKMPAELAEREGQAKPATDREEWAQAHRRAVAQMEELTEAIAAAAREGNADRARGLAKQLRETAMQAARLGMKIEQAGARPDRPRPEQPRREGGDAERDAAKRQIEVLRLAMHAMMEADRKDLAARLEQKIHAIELALAGRRDEEAREIQRRAPGVGDMAEMLNFAADLYRKFEMPDRADMCARLADEYLERSRAAQRREAAGGGGDDDRLRQLQNRIEELARELEEVKRALKEATRER